jgi:hypothetical protein
MSREEQYMHERMSGKNEDLGRKREQYEYEGKQMGVLKSTKAIADR